MPVHIEHLDKEKKIDLITVYDEHSEIKFLNFGMRIVSWKIGNREIVLGPNDSDNMVQYYEENPYCFGATIGRYGGRIANGAFELNGTSYQLEQNDNTHNLHGGQNGLQSKVCDYEIVDNGNIVDVVYSTELKSEDDHFPGNIDLKVIHQYDLAKLKWTITYEAESTEDTLFNPMNHVYFNLNESNESIDNHVIQNDHFEIYPLKDNQIVSTLETININEETGKNLLTFKDIFESGLSQVEKYNGLDHPAKLNEKTFKVSNEDLEVSMETDQEFVVVFTLNDVDWNDKEHSITEHSGFTLEAQSIPDDIHLYGDNAPSILKKGEQFESVTSYQINQIK
nr:hypothetical protein [Mammaliicoccus sp. Marseille-Q6498]